MRRRVDQPDTPTDITLRKYLSAASPQCFVMSAGAGSGKTTSLIKALSSIVEANGADLRKRRQRIACITYTEVAAGEIWADVGNNPLVHVSTIHSFTWMIVKPFQSDIRQWVMERIKEKLEELRLTATNFGQRVQQRTRDKNRRDIARYELEQTRIDQVRNFTYGTGSDYPRGVLGHDDILRISTNFLTERKLFRSLLAQQFPFVLVDESQDTTEGVVAALKSVALQMKSQFCLGFFGDPMQRIYVTGGGAVTIEAGWQAITKPENFRCPTSVLAVANAIRRDDDGLIQTRGRTITVGDLEQPVLGTARMFILEADLHREERILAVREWIARRNGDPTWLPGPESRVKVLVIVHRMAANRLGFGQLYSALNDKAPESFKNGFLDGTAWPVRPFVQFILPLSNAIEKGQEFEVMTLLRGFCPLLEKDNLPTDGISALLSKLREASFQLATMVKPGSGATNREVLTHLRTQRLARLDPRIVSYLDDPVHLPVDAGEEEDEEETTKEINSMDHFLNCHSAEFWGYRDYVDEQSPFSTQQGVKGAEFDKVLVIADDDEGAHFQFSYDKYFGISPLSVHDLENLKAGKETQVERTRRLFYVCCTRAMVDLAVILFTADVPTAERAVRAMNLFAPDQVISAAALIN
jgi:DNA helicase II / ATP-dependent DNA helicase PcrA